MRVGVEVRVEVGVEVRVRVMVRVRVRVRVRDRPPRTKADIADTAAASPTWLGVR